MAAPIVRHANVVDRHELVSFPVAALTKNTSAAPVAFLPRPHAEGASTSIDATSRSATGVTGRTWRMASLLVWRAGQGDVGPPGNNGRKRRTHFCCAQTVPRSGTFLIIR